MSIHTICQSLIKSMTKSFQKFLDYNIFVNIINVVDKQALKINTEKTIRYLREGESYEFNDSLLFTHNTTCNSNIYQNS